MYMYFTKIISRNFIIVEGYEDEVLSREFNFFHSSFSKIMLSILFTWRKVKFHVIFDRKNNNNTTYVSATPRLLRIIKETLILMFFTEVSQIK